MDKMDELEERIHALPHDIAHKIYYDFIETNHLYSTIMAKINSPTCTGLYYNGLAVLIPYITKKPILVKYLQKYDPDFHIVYHQHVILGKRSFDLFNMNNSFALAWLMHRYH